MLTDLAIRNIAIIDEAELHFGEGLTVVTGETGAGKSIAMDALALALGERAGADVIRAGADRAEVTAAFAVSPDTPAALWLGSEDLFGDGECIVRRTVDSKGSRAFINGRPVPAQALRELGALLVDLHGQHEHQSLLRPATQRALLDAYAGESARAQALARGFEQLNERRRQIAEWETVQAQRAAERTLRAHEAEELEALALTREGILDVEAAHRRAAHQAELTAGLALAMERLEDGPEALIPGVSHLSDRLLSLAPYEPGLEALGERLRGLAIELADISREVRSLGDSDREAVDLASLERTLSDIDRMARKHRVAAPELPDVLRKLQAWLAEGEESAQEVAHWRAEAQQLENELRASAERLTEARTVAATRLGDEVTGALPALGMPGARFTVRLEPLAELTSHGNEQVAFEVETNAGQPAKALARIASGGELSRLGLAIQVALARVADVPTLVFDEVDVGIGGRVAEVVGRALASLGERRQVLCVTHLPQVAVYGKHHYHVSKSLARDKMRTMIASLAGHDRAEEIARMLGGVEQSPQTLALAKDLLARGAG